LRIIGATATNQRWGISEIRASSSVNQRRLANILGWCGVLYVFGQEEGVKRTFMNHFYSADRATHLKVVIVALVAGIMVAEFGISMRTQTVRVMKAGKPVMVTTSNKSAKL
jgi:hypothetical protein